jgi:hypothetical protein
MFMRVASLPLFLSTPSAKMGGGPKLFSVITAHLLFSLKVSIIFFNSILLALSPLAGGPKAEIVTRVNKMRRWPVTGKGAFSAFQLNNVYEMLCQLRGL